MRRRLLLSLIVAVIACLGADCDGSSGSNGASAQAQDRFEGQEETPASPAPEPGAALVFGAGLLIVYALRRRR